MSMGIIRHWLPKFWSFKEAYTEPVLVILASGFQLAEDLKTYIVELLIKAVSTDWA